MYRPLRGITMSRVALAPGLTLPESVLSFGAVKVCGRPPLTVKIMRTRPGRTATVCGLKCNASLPSTRTVWTSAGAAALGSECVGRADDLPSDVHPLSGMTTEASESTIVTRRPRPVMARP